MDRKVEGDYVKPGDVRDNRTTIMVVGIEIHLGAISTQVSQRQLNFNMYKTELNFLLNGAPATLLSGNDYIIHQAVQTRVSLAFIFLIF